MERFLSTITADVLTCRLGSSTKSDKNASKSLLVCFMFRFSKRSIKVFLTWLANVLGVVSNESLEENREPFSRSLKADLV